MQQVIVSTVKIKQDGANVRVDFEEALDIRPDDAAEWKPGDVPTGPVYATSIVMPGKAQLLDKDFLSKAGRDNRDCLESRIKRLMVY